MAPSNLKIIFWDNLSRMDGALVSMVHLSLVAALYSLEIDGTPLVVPLTFQNDIIFLTFL